MANVSRMCPRLLRSLFAVRSANCSLPLSQRCQLRLMSVAATETNGTKTEEKPDSTESVQNDVSKAEELFKEEKKKLTDELAATQDKYKRSLAETENVRQRLRKQIDDAKLFGIQGFCKDLFEVADTLNKATESVSKEELNSNPQLNNLYEGLVMTETQLQKVFTRNGLSEINPESGEKFDPNIHEALFQAPPTEGVEPGTVATVTKIGYRLHSRTLRPALVGVYKEK